MPFLVFNPTLAGINYYQQSGSFVVPQGIALLTILACGAGGGYGYGGSGLSGAGGGAGGGLLIARVGGGMVIPFTVGVGGPSSDGTSVGPGSNGGDTVIAGLTFGGGSGAGEDTGGDGGSVSGTAESWVLQLTTATGGQGNFEQGGTFYPSNGFGIPLLCGTGINGGYDGLYGGGAAIPWQSYPNGIELPGMGASEPSIPGTDGVVIFAY